MNKLQYTDNARLYKLVSAANQMEILVQHEILNQSQVQARDAY